MDLATHAVAGLLAARLAAHPDRPPGRRSGLAAVLIAGSMLPDIDVVAALLDPARAPLLRHTATHSLVLLPAMAAALAAAARLAGAQASIARLLAFAATGIALHIFLDLLNAYGVALLYPLSEARYELALLFVVDPVLTGILLLGLLLSRRSVAPRQGTAVAALALLLCAAYLGTAALLRQRADGLVATASAAPLADLVPEPLAPWCWRGIVARPGGYDQYAARPLAGAVTMLPSVASDDRATVLAAVGRARLPPGLEVFLRAPVWNVEVDRVTVHDLRYRFALLGNRWDPFGFTFDRGGSGGDTPRLAVVTVSDRIDRAWRTVSEFRVGSAC